MERWPTVGALADADRADVVRAWSGLGYNRRAVALHEAARHIVAAGEFPSDLRKLVRLPGVGPYTARAIACFAFGQRTAPVDTNVGRVVARWVFGKERATSLARNELQAVADDRLRVPMDPRDVALALMDLGALVCRPAPRCHDCPIATACEWRASGRPSVALRQRREPPFERTARYARGRLLALLREHGTTTLERAAAGLPPWHRAQARSYLEALVRDGLAVRVEDGWALPELKEG